MKHLFFCFFCFLMFCANLSHAAEKKTLADFKKALGGKKPKTMGCKCGIAKKGKFSPKSRKFPDEQVRIVSGYEPQHRPWMVYFQIAQNGNPANFGVCGGSIINKRWVLSAGHCFCINNPCKKNSDGDTVVDYVPKERVMMVTGTRDLKIIQRYRTLYVQKCEQIVVHPKYMPHENDHDDLALVQTEEEFKFDHMRMPICLPYGERFPDHSGDVFVAGWGTQADARCLTDSHGPMPNSKCKFPYKYGPLTMTGCLSSPSPSSMNPICKKAKNNLSLPQMPKPGVVEVEILEKSNVEMLANCYNQTAGSHGWCAVCNPEALAPGDAGYCGSNETNYGSEIPSVDETSLLWGFCQADCGRKGDSLADILKEASLSLIPEALCKKYGSAMNVSTDIELCAGKKFVRSKEKFWAERKGPVASEEDKQEFSFELADGIAPSKELDTTYGGQDACTGDSGGPLWKWVGKKSPKVFVVGVVSRGKGCARRNEAGLYARVKMYLDWIYGHTEGDKCS